MQDNDWENIFLLLSAMMSFDDQKQDTDPGTFEMAVNVLRAVYAPSLTVSPVMAKTWFANHRDDIVELIKAKEDADRVLNNILDRLAPIPVKKDLLMVLPEIAKLKNTSHPESGAFRLAQTG